MVNRRQIKELLLQALESELGGVQIYTTAIDCAVNPALRQEWQQYLDETKRHADRLVIACSALGIDPEEETSGRLVVRHFGEALVAAMLMASEPGDEPAAQLVASECVLLAETKDHANWELIGELAHELRGEEAEALREAHAQTESEEDEHLYHSQGWSRELWIESLGMPAVVPPPEAEADIASTIGHQRATA